LQRLMETSSGSESDRVLKRGIERLKTLTAETVLANSCEVAFGRVGLGVK